MKILYVGDASHYFNRKLIMKLREECPDFNISFFCTTRLNTSETNLPYDKIYKGRNFRIPGFLKVKGIQGVYTRYKMRKLLKEVLQSNDFDIIHLQSLSPCIVVSFPFLKSKNIKLITSVWGSDFYRATNYWKQKSSAIFSNSALITTTNSLTMQALDESYKIPKNKRRIVRFGLEAFDLIDEQRGGVVKSDKFTITIGYNRSQFQQHIKIIESLEKLPNTILEECHFVLPFTYGPQNSTYKAKLKEMLDKLGVSYNILEEFLPDSELARLRLGCDLMIQLQTTDQFSGSMQEYLYAGSVVITGSWLPYGDLDSAGVHMEKVEKVEDVVEKVVYVYENFDLLKSHEQKNRELLYSIGSWSENVGRWKALYN